MFEANLVMKRWELGGRLLERRNAELKDGKARNEKTSH